ncbi:hypothetical protein DBO90_01975 [Mycobacterium avium]|nr:hypothetical protein DBO90_01975 [Mycobacterium avium]
MAAGNTDNAETAPEAPETPTDGSNDVFPRTYVEDLRKESAGYRDKAKQAEERADALAKRLHQELVTATGRLENPADLAFDAEHLDDADKLSAAIDALLADRPYFAKRKVSGDAGQGPRGGAPAEVDLLGMLRGGR